jgi:hypothetical protein
MTERHISYEDLKDLCERQQEKIRELETMIKSRNQHNLERLQDLTKAILSAYEKEQHIKEDWLDELYDIVRAK